MPNFDGGWICSSCWTPNRDRDATCYRCGAAPSSGTAPSPPAADPAPQAQESTTMRPVSMPSTQAATAPGNGEPTPATMPAPGPAATGAACPSCGNGPVAGSYCQFCGKPLAAEPAPRASYPEAPSTSGTPGDGLQANKPRRRGRGPLVLAAVAVVGIAAVVFLLAGPGIGRTISGELWLYQAKGTGIPNFETAEGNDPGRVLGRKRVQRCGKRWSGPSSRRIGVGPRNGLPRRGAPRHRHVW